MVLLASGSTRGVGEAIVCAAARAGADVVLLARELPAGESDRHEQELRARIEGWGREFLLVRGDVRDGAGADRAVAAAIARFDRLDLVLNNASVMCLDGTTDTPLAAFELMVEVNIRGTFLLTRAGLPYLRRAAHGQILTISPPIELEEGGLGSSVPYLATKYAATALTLGWAAEHADAGVSANCLWPHAPLRDPGGVFLPARRQKVYLPEIMGDAAVEVFARPPGQVTGRMLLDAEVLGAAGVTDLAPYVWHRPRHLTGAFPPTDSP
ncbi:SDR family NAD(P)-dependent oxidoreductase [Nocardioides dubius]|uniref:NAD(P)-dependent oxidoreductase n=2 Tax=Nocardioides dubius TaxID=317019 RepID=A0ABP4EHU6_9ACTN